MNGKDKNKWQAVVASEIGSLRENGVCKLVDRPKGKKV